jgi:hypothetical protein
MNNIKINGITYHLISATEVTGKPGRKELKLKRPNGRRAYFAVMYENGVIGEVV